MRYLAIAILWAATAMAQVATWSIDPAHSNAQFSVRHMMVSNVRGEFGKLSGTAKFDAKDPATGSVEVTIDATSINSRNEKRDADLKSPNFFEVAKYPTITFQSRKVERAGPEKLKVTGDLTIHGVTKEVVLDVEGPTPEIKGPGGQARVGVAATARVNRKDFGLMWNRQLDGGGVVVGDDVAITIDAELTKKQ